MTLPLVSELALEFWRASGKRSLSRLRELVRFHAAARGDQAYESFYEEAAIKAARAWEIEAD